MCILVHTKPIQLQFSRTLSAAFPAQVAFVRVLVIPVNAKRRSVQETSPHVARELYNVDKIKAYLCLFTRYLPYLVVLGVSAAAGSLAEAVTGDLQVSHQMTHYCRTANNKVMKILNVELELCLRLVTMID